MQFIRIAAFFIGKRQCSQRIGVKNPPAMPVSEKTLVSSLQWYTKKLLCAKLYVRLPTAHKKSTKGGRYFEKQR